MGQTAENVAQIEHVSRAQRDAWGVRNQTGPKPLSRGFLEHDITVEMESMCVGAARVWP